MLWQTSDLVWHPSGITYMTKAGAQLGDDGRLRFPKSLVEDMIGLSSKDLTLFGRQEKFDMHLSGKKVFFGTAGAAVHVVDVEKKNTETQLLKTYSMQRR